MAGEDFLLKWNDHHSLFFAGAEELCQSEEYTDVTLSAGSRFFPAHKLVLSVCSPYFRQLFARLGNQKSVIYLKDVEPKHLELLLEYMYKGEIKVEEHELVTVLNTAQGLEIRGLTESGKASESDSPTKVAPPALLARPVPPPKRVATPTSPPTRLQQPQAQTFESASKKRKTAPTSSDTLFKIGAVDVTPAPDSPQPPILPSPARERPSVPARPAPPPAPPSQPIVSVKQEVTPTQQDWNSSQSDHQMATYEDSMSQDSYTDTSMAVASYDQGGGYEEGEYYQDDQIGHGEQDDRSLQGWMPGRDHTLVLPLDPLSKPTCQFCGKSSGSFKDLEKHMRTHTGERPYPCNHCHKRFKDPSTRAKHERHLHLGVPYNYQKKNK